MIKIEKKLNKFVESNKQTVPKNKISSLEDLLYEYEESTKKMINNWRNNKYQVTNSDVLEVVSDNNSSPVVSIKGTGSADLLNVFDNTYCMNTVSVVINSM